MASVVKSIRNACWTPEGPVTSLVGRANAAQYDWQYKAIADLLRPICYQEGKCGFKAKADRSCSIRERVDAFEREGVGSQHWGTMQKDMPANNPEVPVEVQLGRQWRIDPSEWLADPKAAR